MGITGAMQPVVTILAAAVMGEILPPLGMLGALGVVGGVIASASMERHVRNLRDAPLADLPSLTGAA
jgi:drug/metabolite transporter (DMT)-like permease